MLRTKLYVCPACGNVIHSVGEAVVSCCGITLPALEAEEADEAHRLSVRRAEDEYYVTVDHEMSKTHYISFIAAVRDDGLEFIKLYPEGNAEARFFFRRSGWLYYYCNQHGLFRQRLDIREMKKVTIQAAAQYLGISPIAVTLSGMVIADNFWQ